MTGLTVRLVAVLLCIAFGSSLSLAQSLSTFVSGVGDDTSPSCSRFAPCRTFSAAVNRTAPNGEVDVLDTAEYGPLQIAKSITIDGTGTVAGVPIIIITLGPASSPTDTVHTVRLRGLSVSGADINTKVPFNGILVQNGYPDLKVVIEDTVIDSFGQDGILYSSNGGELVVKNSTIRNNNTAGIRVDSPGANLVNVTIDHTSTSLNQEGVRFEDNVRGTITNSIASNNTLNGYVVIPDTAPSVMNIDNSTASHNKQMGVFSISNGAASTIRISNMEITENVVSGLSSLFGGQICSNGRNRITTPTQPPTCVFTEQ